MSQVWVSTVTVRMTHDDHVDICCVSSDVVTFQRFNLKGGRMTTQGL